MSTKLIRNSTNFPSQITKLLEEYLRNKDTKAGLFYYQELTRYYFKLNITKGFVANHIMGSGKTKTALAIIEAAIAEGIERIIYVAPLSLEGSLSREVGEYNTLMGSNISDEQFKFIARSHTVVKNITKKESSDNDFAIETNVFSSNLKEIKGRGLVIIDEAHLVMQSISNGSPGMIEFYDLLMNSPEIRIMMLTGTIINSRPFELSPMLNLVSGERIMPETEKTFMDAFWDRENKLIRNKNKLQNRAMGLISRIDQDAIQLKLGEGGKLVPVVSSSPEERDPSKQRGGSSLFPELYETMILQVPMSGRQTGVYMIRREKELKEELGKKSIKTNKTHSEKFSRSDKESSTYMVRTRQCSNYAPPPAIEVLYASDSGYDTKDIKAVMDKALPEEFESPKFIMIDQIMQKHKQQKGIIYSQFVDIGGNGALSLYLQSPERTIETNVNFDNDHTKLAKLKCCGYQQLKFDADKRPINLGPKTFAMLNGSVKDPYYNMILKIYNSPDNDHGEQLPYLLVGTREGLGLDLKCCRFIVMMEPYFIYSFYTQLLARARRYGSHLRLDPKEQDVQPYILLAVYPQNFIVNDYVKAQAEIKAVLTNEQMMKGLAETTDEKIYRLMLNNLRLNKPFIDACDEIGIECNLLKRYFPDRNCRMCAPNNMRLYTELIKGQSPEKLLNYDLREDDPCQAYETEQIEAKRITIKTPDGDIDYFYVVDPASAQGFGIYYYDKDKDLYEELFASSPAYHLVLQNLK